MTHSLDDARSDLGRLTIRARLLLRIVRCVRWIKNILGLESHSYIAERTDEEFEHARLSLLEQYVNPITERRLESIGVARGWRCLEIGAGDGSIVRHLSELVGTKGRVVATDIDTRFLDRFDLSNVEIRRHDICRDPLESDEYDLVHCRAVLMHVPDPQSALSRMNSAVRIGGCLFVEEGDFTSLGAVDRQSHTGRRFDRFANRFLEAMRLTGTFDPYFGRRLPGLYRRLQLQNLESDGAVWIHRGGDGGARFMKMNLEMAAPRLVRAGVIGRRELEEITRLCDDREFEFVDATLFGIRGRRVSA